METIDFNAHMFILLYENFLQLKSEEKAAKGRTEIFNDDRLFFLYFVNFEVKVCH